MIGFGLPISRRRIRRIFFDFPIQLETGFNLLLETGAQMLKEY
jgi:hypothetical protein